MNAYLILLIAITLEVCGTMLLPASKGFTQLKPTLILLTAYAVGFFLLTTIVQELPLVIIYALWSGLGIFSVAILSSIIYHQTLNWQTVIGLFLIVAGVTIISLYKTHTLS
jgi:small multidrug resistance pump